MTVWLKRLAIRLLAWLISDDLAKTDEARILTAERDAATQAPSVLQDAAARLEKGKF